jgi:hypothetical protein
MACGYAITYYLNNDSRDRTESNDSAIVRHIDNRPLHSMHSWADDYAYGAVHCEALNFYPYSPSRDHVHYNYHFSMNMRNPQTFSSTNPLGLRKRERKKIKLKA